MVVAKTEAAEGYGVRRVAIASSFPFRMVDAAVVLTLVFAVVLAPWQYDEGAYDLTILNARTTGVYSHVIANGDAAVAFKPWYALLNLFCFPSLGPGHAFVMRIPGLALAVLGWGALVAALNFLELRSLLARAAAGFVWTITAVDFLVNLRPEAGYVVPLTVALLLSLEWIRAARRSVVLAGLALTSVSAGVHPCSCLVPLVLIVAAPFGRPGFSWRDARWIVPAAIAAAAAGAMMILWDQTPQAFVDNLRAAANIDHTQSWDDEWMRYLRFMWYDPAEFKAYLIGFVALPFLFLSRQISGRVRAVLAAQLLAIAFFLVLYPTKWQYYVSAYAPWLCVSWAYAVETVATMPLRLPIPVGVGVVLTCFWVGVASDRFVPSLSPEEASLFRAGVLRPLLGAPANDQETSIDSIPALVGAQRVLIEPYMFPLLPASGLNKARFDDTLPPEFIIMGAPESIIDAPEFMIGDQGSKGPFRFRWPKARWTPELHFWVEGRLVVVAKLASPQETGLTTGETATRNRYGVSVRLTIETVGPTRIC